MRRLRLRLKYLPDEAHKGLEALRLQLARPDAILGC